MNAYRLASSLILVLFILSSHQIHAEVDWSKIKCPASKSLYINEAIKLIVSGYKSSPHSPCLSQDKFNFFNISFNDLSDKPNPRAIILNDNFKSYIISKEMGKQGKLFVTYKIVNGKEVYTDKFSLYFNKNEKGFSEIGCAAFFELPTQPFLLSSCKK